MKALMLLASQLALAENLPIQRGTVFLQPKFRSWRLLFSDRIIDCLDQILVEFWDDVTERTEVN